MEKNIVLKDIRKVNTYELPSFSGSKVVLYDGLLFGDMKKLNDIKEDFERGVQSLLCLLKDWNFVNESGDKVPANRDSLDQLPSNDLTFLLNKVADFFTETEKKSKKISKK